MEYSTNAEAIKQFANVLNTFDAISVYKGNMSSNSIQQYIDLMHNFLTELGCDIDRDDDKYSRDNVGFYMALYQKWKMQELKKFIDELES